MEAIEIVRIRLDYADLVQHFGPEGTQASGQTGETDRRQIDRYSTQNLCLQLLTYIADMAAALRRGWRIRLIGGGRRPAAAIFGSDPHRPLVAIRVYVPTGRRPRPVTAHEWPQSPGQLTELSRAESAQTEVPQNEVPLEVEIERDLAFPHPLAAIVSYLRARVPRLRVVRPIHTIETGLCAPPRPAATDRATTAGDTSPPARGRPRGKGAPPLACNQWLERQLARLAPHLDDYDINTLYAPWLARYVALRGFQPQDPRRSFRAAVAGAQKRLAKSASKSRSGRSDTGD